MTNVRMPQYLETTERLYPMFVCMALGFGFGTLTLTTEVVFKSLSNGEREYNFHTEKFNGLLAFYF